ncbi:hypothetical protein KVV02_001133 [Mortierella alpina]|uniref:Serine aminopeptidase S33 domain-containing protein n=1 Tax=Mortierella alpina TaxID=64518 RepID=A0A9P8AAX0_MORAP|nr:hypothetical protein KVV02_001133 [Mortierella alpina]
MPFVQPMGVSVGSRPNNVKSIINSFNNPPPKQKPEAEKSCQVKNNWAKSADDSIHIFTKTWQPIGVSVHSVVVFVHDIVEHCEKYQPLFVLFAGKGIEVQSFDLPGFGETGARADALGITGGYSVLLKEIDNALDRALTTRPSKPIFLMGHGMGGALVLNYVCGLGQRITSLAGIMVSSPYLRPAISGAGTRFPSTYNRLGKWYPNISVSFQVSPQELTRDHAEQERHHGDGLIRDSVSLRCLGDMIYQGQKMLKKRWKQFPPALPTLLLHGTDDPICSYQATSTLNTILQKLEPTNLKFKSWKGNKHDPHWDLDADAVRSEYIHWIRNISRNYVKPPLEAETVHTDTLKVAKPTASLGQRGKRTKTTTKTTTDPQSDASPSNSKGKQPSTSDSQQPAVPTTPSSASAAEPEAIQDLAGLRRQQELKLQRAMEKRQEYNLLSNGKSTAAADHHKPLVAGSTAASEVSGAPEATSETDSQKPPSPVASPDSGANATEKIPTVAATASVSASETENDTAPGVTNELTTAAGADRSASAPNLADTTAGATIHLTTPPRAEQSASAPNLADTAAGTTIHLTPPPRADQSASAPNLADTAAGTTIHLTTPPRAEQSASAPNLADTAAGTTIHLTIPPRADQSASAPNLADTTAGATILLTAPPRAEQSASAPNLADTTAGATILLKTPPRADQSASAPNLADTTTGATMDTRVAEADLVKQVVAVLPEVSTIPAVTDDANTSTESYAIDYF